MTSISAQIFAASDFSIPLAAQCFDSVLTPFYSAFFSPSSSSSRSISTLLFPLSSAQLSTKNSSVFSSDLMSVSGSHMKSRSSPSSDLQQTEAHLIELENFAFGVNDELQSRVEERNECRRRQPVLTPNGIPRSF